MQAILTCFGLYNLYYFSQHGIDWKTFETGQKRLVLYVIWVEEGFDFQGRKFGSVLNARANSGQPCLERAVLLKSIIA